NEVAQTAGSGNELLPSHVTTGVWPRVPPSVSDFYAKCPGSPGDPRWTIPDPSVQVFLLASLASVVFDSGRKWPRVDPDAFPIVQAEGLLNEANISSIDSPFIHGSHDLDMPISTRRGDQWIGLDGSSTLVLETESGGIPLAARPTVGDHVTVKGRWIFDCGHEPKTEIHPDYYVESDRIENRSIWPGGSLHPVRIVRVWVNSNPGPWGFSRDLSGTLSSFDFDADFPGSAGSWMPFVRLVTGQSDHIVWSGDSTTMHFTVTPPATTGQYYFELMLGHLIQADEPSTRDSRTYTIAFDHIDILNDRDAGLPDCDFVLGFPTSDCGEWYMPVNVNGAWRQIFWNTSVLDDSGQNRISLAHIEPITVVGRDIDFQVSAYDDDYPLDGELVTSCRFNCMGPPTAFRSLLGPQVLEPAGSDWRLAYTVTEDGEAPSTLVEESYWAPRMAGETGLGGALDLGVIPVSARGAPPAETLQAATFIEQPLTHSLPDGGYIRLMGDDFDFYSFTLSDLATLAVDTPTPGAVLSVWESYPASWPEEVRRVIGPTGARVLAVSDPALRTGDMPYTVRIRASYRELSPDWGEIFDAPGPGRLVDLRTPDPRAGVRLRHSIENATIGIFETWPEVRDLNMDWAWQHVAGDVDDYLIRIPPLSSGPGCDVDRTDRPGQLSLSAYGMRMRIPALGIDTRGAVDIDLSALFPLGGDILLHVENDPGRRGVYRLVARWTDAVRLTEDECSRARAARTRAEEMASILTTWDEARAMAHMFGVGPGQKEPPGELTLTPRCPGAGPSSAQRQSGPLRTSLGLLDRRCWAMADTGLLVEAGGLVDMMIASPAGKSVRARLYGLDGVMLGESVPSVDSFGQPSAATASGAGDPQRGPASSPSVAEIQIPDGLTQQSRLRVDGLKAGNLYLLRIVPDFQIDPADTATTPVAISEVGRDAFRLFMPFIARGK
ncbi:MAG: hypothetical protein Q8R28_11695, partial [Dehalococcoidia bacterium]|nr:hypothetical protein [Dehalococcoidia bacterium]